MRTWEFTVKVQLGDEEPVPQELAELAAQLSAAAKSYARDGLAYEVKSIEDRLLDAGFPMDELQRVLKSDVLAVRNPRTMSLARRAMDAIKKRKGR
jgi:hypothetical protein